jgi:hypothetical protein
VTQRDAARDSQLSIETATTFETALVFYEAGEAFHLCAFPRLMRTLVDVRARRYATAVSGAWSRRRWD